MRRYILRVITGAGLLTLLASAAFAQLGAPAPNERGGEGQRARGRVGRRQTPDGPRADRLGLGRLNLSDAQREQLRGIESRYAAGFRTRREELRSIRQSRRQGGALTAEQEARAHVNSTRSFAPNRRRCAPRCAASSPTSSARNSGRCAAR